VDDAPGAALDRLRSAVTDLRVVPVSSIDDALLDSFKDELWRLTGLVRVFLAHGGQAEGEPVALEPGSTISDVARSIHQDLADTALGARVWGPSARFPGQQVGKLHQIQDGDKVEILA